MNLLPHASSSFMDYLRQAAPECLPGGPPATETPTVHGTTIVACRYRDGVVMAGDRRATVGTLIAMRDIEKVFGADEHTVIGVAGVAGIAVELVRLFQVELEHFEKIEGVALSFDGKANRLGALLRSNLSQTLQGLGVLPLFIGWDPRAQRGRMFSFDITGGRYEEHQFCCVGSGSAFARGALKKLHDPDADERIAVMTLLQCLYDAADDDSATSGLDLTRSIFPLVMRASGDGVDRWSEGRIRELAEDIAGARVRRPDGPRGAVL